MNEPPASRASSHPHPDAAVVPGGVQIFRKGQWQDYGYFLIASGYLVRNRRVLLVRHNRFGLWVPPGGHVEAGDTFAQTATREFEEETGVKVEVVSAQPAIWGGDSNATPEPMPFYVDVEREGFAKPALVHYYYVRATGSLDITPQLSEVDDCRWFDYEDLETIGTFDQVRVLSLHALTFHPDAR